MFCSKCGAENPDEARFCGKCSSPLLQSPGQGAGPVAAAGQPAVSSELKIIIIVVTIIIPLVGLVMGGIYMADPNPEKKSVGKLWLILGAAISLFWCFMAMVGNLGV